MKTHVLNGVPYSVADTGEVYMYNSDIHVGQVTSDKKGILFLDNWRENASAYLNAYRAGLRERTSAMMEKARGQYKQPN
jgi:hypothetical protein